MMLEVVTKSCKLVFAIAIATTLASSGFMQNLLAHAQIADDKSVEDDMSAQLGENKTSDKSAQSPASGKVCSCVIFRLDDVTDFNNYNLSLAIMDLFLEKDQPLTLALVMGKLGDNRDVIAKVADGQKKGLFELAGHGWEHTSFNGTGMVQQDEWLSSMNEKMQQVFGRSSNVFVPPLGPFDNDTLQAMAKNGIKIISSEYQIDKFPFFEGNLTDSVDENGIYHIPTTAKFYDYATFDAVTHKGQKIPVENIVETMEESIGQYGWAVVVIHPQDLRQVVDGESTKELDEAGLKDLASLIDAVAAENMTITTFSQLTGIPLPPVKDVRPPEIDPVEDIAIVVNETSITSENGVHVPLEKPIVNDLIDPTPTVTSDAPTNSLFSIGTTRVTWTAKDDAGNAANLTQYVTLSTNDDSAAPNISITSPAEDAIVSRPDGQPATLTVSGIATDGDDGTGIKRIQIRTGNDGGFTRFIDARLSSSENGSGVEWRAPARIPGEGDTNIIAKITDYFGNEKTISVPIIVRVDKSNSSDFVTKSSLVLDPLRIDASTGNVSVSGRLVAPDTTNDSKISEATTDTGVGNQTISFTGTFTMPETVTDPNGYFHSTAIFPRSFTPTVSELKIQAHYSGNDSHKPADSPLTAFLCGSIAEMIQCTASPLP